MDHISLGKLLTKKQGDIEEKLKHYGGMKTIDLTKEDVFAYMKYKAEWELITELLDEYYKGHINE